MHNDTTERQDKAAEVVSLVQNLVSSGLPQVRGQGPGAFDRFNWISMLEENSSDDMYVKVRCKQ